MKRERWTCIGCAFPNYRNSSICWNCAKRRYPKPKKTEQPKKPNPIQMRMW